MALMERVSAHPQGAGRRRAGGGVHRRARVLRRRDRQLQPKALPPVEIDFSGLPEGVVKVMDSKAKWDERSKEYKGTRSVLAQLPDELRARLQKSRWTPTAPCGCATTAGWTSAHRHRRHLRARGERELLPGPGQRVRDGRGGGGSGLQAADRADRGPGPGAAQEAEPGQELPAARGSSPAPSPASSPPRSPPPPGSARIPAAGAPPVPPGSGSGPGALGKWAVHRDTSG